MKGVLPFTVIGSNYFIEEDGHRLRGRQHPLGLVEVENTKHCDFARMKWFLLKTHLQDLKDMASDVLFENYLAKYITEGMPKRLTDRREGGGLRSDRENGPRFEAIVDHDSLLKQKEEERDARKIKTPAGATNNE
ncbi:Septin-5 [Fasciola gigantica]|uniref:Septin-5 n=1 Tax=Fasciola gigantica TaxID=46835 RepID=A0A504YR21_FASGI|nr:Septin-5 [Fasciola gigantica]